MRYAFLVMPPVLLGLYTYLEFGLCTAAFLPVMGVSWHKHRGDPTQRQPGRWMRRFGRVTTGLTPIWDFSVEGAAPHDIATKPYMVVANHESTADPFLLSHLPWDMRWVAKEEIFKLPVLGLMMKYGGDIPLRRGRRESIVEMMDECRRTLDAGQSIMMFPEGTRGKDDDLLPFKPGAFEIAVRSQVPILPIALSGTRACRPKGSKWFGHAKATAKILEPIPTTGLTSDDVADLAERTRVRISAALPELRARTTFIPRGAAALPPSPRASAA